MSVVHGKNVVVEMLVDGNYFPIFCGTDCTFSRNPEFIEKTTTTSGLFREFAVRIEEWSMSVTGLTKIENDTSLTFFYMLQSSVRRTRQDFRMTFEDDLGDTKQISGAGFIGQASINGPQTDFSTAQIEIRGTGQFSISEVTPPVPETESVYADYWNTVNGQNYISGASTGNTDGTSYTLLGTDEILDVYVENMKFYATTGTPQNGYPEYKYNTANDRLEFPAALVFDGSQKVFVMFKRTA